MSAEKVSDISSALAQTFAPELVRVWNRQANLSLNLDVRAGGGQGGGQNVAWDVEFSGATAASFDEGADITSTFNQDPLKPAVLAWGQYQSSFSLTNKEINIARSNISNATAIEDIVGERFLGSISKIVSVMNKDMFSGTGTDGSGNPTIIGLDVALDTTTSYGGLSRVTYAEWQGNVNANGGTGRPLSMALLASTEAQVFTASGIEPDMLFTTAAVHTKYENLFEAVRRTVDSGQGPIPSYQGSTGRLYWRGKPVVRDRDATAGRLYMLRKDLIDLRVLPWANVMDYAGEQRQAVSTNGMDMQAVAIPFHVYPLARTGSAVKFAVEVYAQLKVARPNAHAILADISES